VYRFERYLVALRVAFPAPHSLTLTTLIQRQRLYMHGAEQRVHRLVPRIIDLLVKKLIVLSEKENRGKEVFDYLIKNTLSTNSNSKTDTMPKHVKEFVVEVNEDVFFGLEAEDRYSSLIDVLIYWLHSLKVKRSSRFNQSRNLS
jgi:hypothetical protein